MAHLLFGTIAMLYRLRTLFTDKPNPVQADKTAYSLRSLLFA